MPKGVGRLVTCSSSPDERSNGGGAINVGIGSSAI
jgi:hypothetical protein